MKQKNEKNCDGAILLIGLMIGCGVLYFILKPKDRVAEIKPLPEPIFIMPPQPPEPEPIPPLDYFDDDKDELIDEYTPVQGIFTDD